MKQVAAVRPKVTSHLASRLARANSRREITPDMLTPIKLGRQDDRRLCAGNAANLADFIEQSVNGIG